MSPKLENLRLYNTLTRTVEQFTPLNPPKVGIYCCGPTVYNYQHIGNMRTYTFEDILVRWLRALQYEVNHVMNITDVGHLVGDGEDGEDKMLVAARREKKKSEEIAQYYTDVFFKDCDLLNINRPNVVCKATEHIAEMIKLIERLVARDHAYVANGNVYFDVSKLSDYGKLARLKLDTLQAGARIEIDSSKRSPFDFVLWFTKSKFENHELLWDSPWGKGYPGWHIECSAMSMRYLGEQFDIHCGGIDHVPVHHTNEIAQSEGATGRPWVRYWMHGEFLVVNNQKMAKSAGTFFTLEDVVARGYSPQVVRWFFLSAHYRTQLSFSWEALDSAKAGYDSITKSIAALVKQSDSAIQRGSSEIAGGAIFSEPHWQAFEAALSNDLNCPQGVAALWGLVNDRELSPARKVAIITEIDKTLGVDLLSLKENKLEIPAAVQSLFQERLAARANKNWPESDRLRAEIEKLGFVVEDKGKKSTLKAK